MLPGRDLGTRLLVLGAIAFCGVPVHATSRQVPSDPPMVLRDRFGRDLRERGVLLVDWEGHIANPVCRLSLSLHPRVNLPARVVLRANGCRLMFDLFSEVGADGPSKTLLYEGNRRRADFLMAIFPDHDGADEDYELTAELTTGVGERRTLRWPVHVLDQDRNRPSPFTIALDYTQDRTGFFESGPARRILERAVTDWAYFLDEQGFDSVEAGAETAFIHDPTTFESGWNVTNPRSYRGFLLFAQGIRGPEKRSGGRASDGGELQTRDGKPTGLRRSGTVISEVTGNWNGLGWSMEDSDDRWWVSSCHAREPHDYYSVVRHEVGHCLIYHRVHPAFAHLSQSGTLRDREIEHYLGRRPRVNASEHLFDTVDPASRAGAFGNEYGGDMPRKRWLITKLDLLVMKAVGYRVRTVTPLEPLVIPRRMELVAEVGRPCEGRIEAQGGVPAYCFSVVGGRLPEGVELDSFMGTFHGAPKTAGIYRATVTVADSDATRRPVRTTVTFHVKGRSGPR